MTAEPALTVENLGVAFPTGAGLLHAVRDVSFAVRAGQVLGIVGESGAGKTVTALACLRLLPAGTQVRGTVRLGRHRTGLAGVNLLDLNERQLAGIRGGSIALVPQDPLAALNPVRTVGAQLAETVRAHHRTGRRQAHARAVELLEAVGVPAAQARSYPHQLSGGLRQRVVIALAMVGEPDVIIADEPTAALDVTVQAQVLQALVAAAASSGAALVLITHDFGVLAGHADRVLVLYAGKVVEAATVDALFHHARMPYTLGLLGAVPRLDTPADRPLVTIPAATTSGHGCAFEPRCPLARARCHTEEPVLRLLARHRHLVACHLAEELHGEGGGPFGGRHHREESSTSRP